MGETATDSNTSDLAQVRVDIAGLTGRIDQVILDHRARIDKIDTDLSTEKRERIEDTRRLEAKLEDHAVASGQQRATLAANVTDLQNDSAEYRKRLDSAWSRVLQGGAAVAAMGALVVSVYTGTHH